MRSAAAESKTAAANSVKAAEAAKAKAEDVVKGIADTKAEAIAQIEAAGVEATQNIKGYTKEETNALLRAAGIHTQVGAPIYGVKRVWNTESVSDTWERTDASVGMEANPTIGTKVGKDDFSYVMPWAGIVSKCCDLDTGETIAYIGEPGYDPTKYMVLTEYPGYYLKRWRDDTYEYVQISAGAFDGAVYIEPWEWGRYPSSLMGSKHVSMSGKHPDCRINRATVRARSKAAGEGYYSMDSTSYWAYSMLVLVKYAKGKTYKNVKHTKYWEALDIKKCYDNILHCFLKFRLIKMFKDKRLLELLFMCIDIYWVKETAAGKRGIPIGTPFGHWFANIMLTPVDF